MKEFVIFQQFGEILHFSENVSAPSIEIVEKYCESNVNYNDYHYYVAEVAEDNRYKFEDKDNPGSEIEWDGYSEIGMN